MQTLMNKISDLSPIRSEMNKPHRCQCRIKGHLHSFQIEISSLFHISSSSREIINQFLTWKKLQKSLGKLAYQMEVGLGACCHFNTTIYLMEVMITFSIREITRPMMRKTLHPWTNQELITEMNQEPSTKTLQCGIPHPRFRRDKHLNLNSKTTELEVQKLRPLKSCRGNSPPKTQSSKLAPKKKLVQAVIMISHGSHQRKRKRKPLRSWNITTLTVLVPTLT